MTLKGQAKIRIKQNLKTLKIYGYGQKINNNDHRYHKTRQIDRQTNRQRDRLSRSYKKYHGRNG